MDQGQGQFIDKIIINILYIYLKAILRLGPCSLEQNFLGCCRFGKLLSHRQMKRGLGPFFFFFVDDDDGLNYSADKIYMVQEYTLGMDLEREIHSIRCNSAVEVHLAWN